MEKLTLRDAADRTGLSITTLRRYIRSGRLVAEKVPGRYGPEYTVSTLALQEAGVRSFRDSATNGVARAERSPAEATAGALSPRASYLPAGASAGRGEGGGTIVPETVLRDMIPIDLFRELSMKHEQLLVQYGMVRVGGQKMMEYKIESEQLADRLRRSEEATRAERESAESELGFLKKHLRQAELEIEGKNQEIAALREKVRMLELISRNAITNESIEHQFLHVFDKRRELEELEATSSDERRRKMAALDELLRSGFRVRPDEDPTDQ